MDILLQRWKGLFRYVILWLSEIYNSSIISKNVDSQDVTGGVVVVVVVVVVAGLAAAQWGLLVTSSSLAWPGLGWPPGHSLIPAEITFIRSHRLPIISQLPGNSEESHQIIHVFRKDFTVVPLVFVKHFSWRFCFQFSFNSEFLMFKPNNTQWHHL